jgi:pyruvate/2-oxoglutarate dehydrogenase complex dihydrolipoamide dehydrogenase (E3) component
MNLEKIGIAMDEKRILIDDRCVTSLSHIFASGDCASPIAVVHIAVVQGEIAGTNAERVIRDGHATSSSASWNRDTAMNGLFTDPQCVEIGINEKTAAKKTISILVGKTHYNDQGKGMIAGSRHGFTKIIADASSRKIIGAVGVGPVVLETSHFVQLAIETGMTLEEFTAITPYHPTLTEAWTSAAQAALED